MSYEIDYTETRDEPETKRAAILDLIQYIGLKRTKILMRAARYMADTGKLDQEGQFIVAASFAGVQGFPVLTLWDYCTDPSAYRAIRGGHVGFFQPSNWVDA